MSNVSNWLRERCWGSPCFTDEHIEVLWERVVELETENAKMISALHNITCEAHPRGTHPDWPVIFSIAMKALGLEEQLKRALLERDDG